LFLLALCVYVHAQTAGHYDVVIDEIMAYSNCGCWLAKSEFTELRNVSAQSFNLIGCKIGDASHTATFSTNFILKPDSFIIICANAGASLVAASGATIGITNFPYLNNDGDQLYIRSGEGAVIDAVAYNSSWYQNAVNNNGGRTLEMIDTKIHAAAQPTGWPVTILKEGYTGKKEFCWGHK
jgi:hypothetical protein